MDKTKPSNIENTILDTLTQIQGSIATLETKYNDIEAKIADAPKTYADIIKSSTTLSKKDPKIEARTQRRKQQEALRKEMAKFTVTLSTKNAKPSTQTWITETPGLTIAQSCITKTIKTRILPESNIRAINKLTNAVRIHFETGVPNFRPMSRPTAKSQTSRLFRSEFQILSDVAVFLPVCRPTNRKKSDNDQQ